MPISQYTQPAQGTYQPSYVAPPVQQLGQIGERIQQEQQAQRQAAQQFATQLEGMQVGADAPKAQEKIQEMKKQINKAAKNVGYNLRSPEFRSRFQNIKSQISSDPFWTTAPQKAKEAQQIKQKLQENRYNLPSYVVNRTEDQLARYQRYGSIDPETGTPIQFTGVPEEVPDVVDYINESLLGDVTEEDMKGFRQGIPQNKVARALGISIGEDEEGNAEYKVNRIPLDGPEDRALSEEAEYMARQYARRTGEDLTREDVMDVKKQLWLNKSMSSLVTKPGGTTDWGARAAFARNRIEAMKNMQGAGMGDPVRAEALDFASLIYGSPEESEKGEQRGTASINSRAIYNWMGIGENEELNIGDFNRRLGESREDDILINDPSAIGAEDFQNKVDQIADINRYQANSRNFTRISDMDITDFASASTAGEGQFGTNQKLNTDYDKLAQTYAYATGNTLEEDYDNISERIVEGKNAVLNNKGVPSDLKNDIRDIKNKISESLMDKRGELPDDMKDKEKSFELFKALGLGLKGVGGRHKFKPKQGENLIRTRHGIYVGGDLRMTKKQAENMLERANEFTDADVPNYRTLTTDDAYKNIVSVDTDEEGEKEYIEIDTWLKAPTDAQSTTEAFMGQMSPVLSGQLDFEKIRKIKTTMQDYANNQNALIQQVRENTKKQQNQEEE